MALWNFNRCGLQGATWAHAEHGVVGMVPLLPGACATGNVHVEGKGTCLDAGGGNPASANISRVDIQVACSLSTHLHGC